MRHFERHSSTSSPTRLRQLKPSTWSIGGQRARRGSERPPRRYPRPIPTAPTESKAGGGSPRIPTRAEAQLRHGPMRPRVYGTAGPANREFAPSAWPQAQLPGASAFPAGWRPGICRQFDHVTVPARMPDATSVQPVLGLAQPTMLEIPQPHALDLVIPASEADREHAIEAFHRKKRARRGEFDTDQERSGVAVHSEVEALVHKSCRTRCGCPCLAVRSQ